MTNMCLIGRVV